MDKNCGFFWPSLLFFDSPSRNYAQIQTKATNNDKDWKFFINYDVKRPQDGNEVQISGGRFVHYFAPDNIPTIPKHIIFVIDISGSMAGRKLEQTKDSMTTMLTKMSEARIDSFNIIVFESNVIQWKPFGNRRLSYSIPRNKGDVSQAYDYLLKLKAGGSTNIDQALTEAINLAFTVKRNEEIGSETQQMIVFLTDGEPTEGETSGSRIKANVHQNNAELQIPVYGLAFGEGADFNLLKEISDGNKGFAQKIYESGNSFEQLEDFYNKISGNYREHNFIFI